MYGGYLSSSNGCDALPSAPIAVDTQPNETKQHDTAAPPLQAAEEYEVIRQQEEREILQLVRNYEAEQEAKHFREQEQRQFQEELNAGAKKQRRMQVSIHVSTSTDRGATTWVDIPVPGEGNTTFVTLALKVKDDVAPVTTSTSTTSVDGGDANAMVQTTWHRSVRHGRCRLQVLLQGIQDEVRSRILKRLRGGLQQKAYDLIDNLGQTLGMLEEMQDIHVDEDDITAAEKHAAQEQAEMILARLRSYLEEAQGREPEDELHDLLVDAGAALQMITATESYGPRRRRTAASSSQPTDVNSASKKDVEDLAEDIKCNIDMAVAARPYEHRADILKSIAVGIIMDTQLTASRLRVLLLLMGPYLPQQRTTSNLVNAASSFGHCLWRDARDRLSSAFSANASTLGTEPFGLDEAIPIMHGLSPLAVEIMTMLENGTCPLESSEHESEDTNTPDYEANYGRAPPPRRPRLHPVPEPAESEDAVPLGIETQNIEPDYDDAPVTHPPTTTMSPRARRTSPLCDAAQGGTQDPWAHIFRRSPASATTTQGLEGTSSTERAAGIRDLTAARAEVQGSGSKGSQGIPKGAAKGRAKASPKKGSGVKKTINKHG